MHKPDHVTTFGSEKVLDEGSLEQALQIFQPQDYEPGVENSYRYVARPLEAVKGSEGPFMIPLPRDPHRSLSLNSIRLHMKLSVEMFDTATNKVVGWNVQNGPTKIG